MEVSSMTIPVPSVMTTSPGGGRFDFDDGGTYWGGWQDGKAHGHGVCTGLKNVGEYSGSWNFGFEICGVYKWKNGAVYEGRWQNGKRHGVGVEYNGKWIYKGEWSQGFKGRYGVKANSCSAVKYEGTWANGLQDGYGSETYSDGGYYQGQMCKGLRHGYGVRKSAPYGDSNLTNPGKNGGQVSSSSGALMIHSNSLQSSGSVEQAQEEDDSPKPEDGFKPRIERTLISKNGFVLVAKPLDVPMAAALNASLAPANHLSGASGSGLRAPSANQLQLEASARGAPAAANRRSSFSNRLASAARIPGSKPTASLLRGLRLRKQKSTSDLDAMAGGRAGAQLKLGQSDEHLPAVPFTLSSEELDITDPSTVETYTGEWKHDKRTGHGVCERSDGLRYEGQWHNDMKCGYGVTTFRGGAREEGKYKNNILIQDSKVKRLFHLGGASIRQRIDEAVKMANQAQTMALKKAEIAESRAATARDKADQATTAAQEAERESMIAYAVARQYCDSGSQFAQFAWQSGAALMAPTMLAASGAESLGAPASSLQMRRTSQAAHYGRPGALYQPAEQRPMEGSQQQQYGNSANHFHPNHSQQQLPHQTDHLSQQQQPLEPFNGRRGSFRGAGGGSQPSGGYQGGAFASSQRGQQMAFGAGAGQARQADQFADLFDHYKGGSQPTTRRPMPSKQSSLDYANYRPSPAGRPAGAAGERLRRFRMSSLDHPEESQSQRAPAGQAHLHLQRQSSRESQQDQLRHLVTPGEELQQQYQQLAGAEQLAELAAGGSRALTPTGGSLAAHSSVSYSASYAGLGPTTPSPEAAAAGGSLRAASARTEQFYAGQSVSAATPTPSAHPSAGQAQAQTYQSGGQSARPFQAQPARDVHSLLDEQLYYGRQSAEHSDYAKWDFAITSAHSARTQTGRLRRTASLSRQPSGRPPVGSGLAEWAPRPASGPSLSRLASLQRQSSLQSQHQQQQPSEQPLQPEGTHFQPRSGADAHRDLCQAADAGSSASLALARKRSLQVRYDPAALGGLMSREEAAALSHAQRDRHRLEAELAEKRARQPLLHLCLSLAELLTKQRLLLCVFAFNALLFKLFADLIR